MMCKKNLHNGVSSEIRDPIQEREIVGAIT